MREREFVAPGKLRYLHVKKMIAFPNPFFL